MKPFFPGLCWRSKGRSTSITSSSSHFAGGRLIYVGIQGSPYFLLIHQPRCLVFAAGGRHPMPLKQPQSETDGNRSPYTTHYQAEGVFNCHIGASGGPQNFHDPIPVATARVSQLSHKESVNVSCREANSCLPLPSQLLRLCLNYY